MELSEMDSIAINEAGISLAFVPGGSYLVWGL